MQLLLGAGALQVFLAQFGNVCVGNFGIIYDNITGALYFDADGSAGEFTQVKFAQLSVGLSLTENNFVVV